MTAAQLLQLNCSSTVAAQLLLLNAVAS